MSSSYGVDSAIAGAIAAKQGAVATQVGIAVAVKQLEATKQQGAAINELLASAVALSKSLSSGFLFDAVG